MGQAESTQAHEEIQTGVAFHVLRVAEQSPAAQAGIDPFFDFLCGVNGQPLGDDIEALNQVLARSEGQMIVLQVWSTKRKELRNVQLVPSRSWSTTGSSAGTQPSLLGLSLRLCNPLHALDQVWHVLEILEGSPAQSAGLVPFGDWIVGYAGGILRGEGDFYDVVEAHVDKPLRLFVYNADYDVTREAILVPNRSWGGEGLLGCGVGYGLLHRIPKPQDRAIPSETEDRFDVDEEEQVLDGQQDYYDPNGRRGYGSGGDGYEEASYEQEGDVLASEGVQVVAVEDSYDGFTPADSYSQGPSSYGRQPAAIPTYGEQSTGSPARGYAIPAFKPPPRSPSSGAFGGNVSGEIIREEEEV